MSWVSSSPAVAGGRTFVVTGGNAGLGYFTAEQLAGAGARVIIAARSADRTAIAIDSIRDRVPGAEVSHLPFDLTSLAVVREAASRIRDSDPSPVSPTTPGSSSPRASGSRRPTGSS